MGKKINEATSAISRLESRTDFKISTLIDYISQLDLELVLLCQVLAISFNHSY